MAATRARPLWNAEGVGEGRGAPRRQGPERASHPRAPGGTRLPEGCTWDSGAGSRRQGGWLSRVEVRRTPIPAACSPRGLQRAHRRHRRGLGFIYPDGRARPGNRNTEAFSCFLTAWPSRRTFCGRGIHVPGPARGSLRARPAAGTAVNPRRGAAAAGARGSPRPSASSQADRAPSSASLAGAEQKCLLPSHVGEKWEKSQVAPGSGSAS